MRCPQCGHEIAVDTADRCDRCGARLDSEREKTVEAPRRDTEATAEEPRGNLSPATEETDTSDPLLRDFLVALKGTFVSGGWAEAAGTAAFAIAAIAGAGAVLVLAGKLDSPSLGTSANPLEVLSAVVIAGLACLGVPVSLGGFVVSALPLGALAVLGYALMWAARTSVGRREVGGAGARAVEGAKLGPPLAVYCLVAALVFQVRGTFPVAAVPWAAFLLGGFWGAIFGALGGLLAAGSLRGEAILGRAWTKMTRSPFYGGVAAAGIMLIATALLSFAALLLWIIVALARGAPAQDLTAGDAAAALVYMFAFLPNLLVLVASFAVGAPIEVGARVGFGGSFVGGFESFSITGLGGSSPSSAALLLLAVPLIACLLGGFSARRNRVSGEGVFEALVGASLTYALALAALASIGAVRLGAGVTGRGVGRLAPEPVIVFACALAWAALFGWLGWMIADSVARDRSGASTGG